jgi:hypothetical protein
VANPPHIKRFDQAVIALQKLPDPLARLDALRRFVADLEQLEAQAVADARAAGVTWIEIGALYGLSKQGAQQRFRRSKPAPARHASVASE